MIIKPNRLRAFIKTFLWIFIFTVVFTGLVPHFQGKTVDFEEIFGMTLIGGSIMSICVTFMFTPREINWDQDEFTIKALFPGSGRFTWQQLEAYTPFGRGMVTFLIKFEGQQAFQIVPAGFRSDEWNAFQSVLSVRFPEKKTWFWFGPIPVRFRKK